ncbi:MAG TPA: carboxyl transferase domain-containing protein [Oligoflexia bacterium]|nr:carboxyl transferase domain-containing protein [Oligoflexia bacterium]HMP27155.1 carboxyl transferase domain-containing protein [Oligoflexia bacterium]
MPLKSLIDTNSQEFLANYQSYKKILENFELLKEEHRKPSDNDPSLARHLERGKLYARDRIAALLDLASPFLEIGYFAGLDIYQGVKRAGAGIICGIGTIEGQECMIVANDATHKGGTYYPLTVKKHLRAQEIALENRLPCIYLVDSGGAFLPLQDQVFPDRDHFGRIFYNQARMSSLGIPQISVVMGSCTAGGAYVPAMSDQTIMVKNQATIFLGGPPLVKAATGQIVSAEELGGADVHSKISGVSDYLAEDDLDGLKIARQIVSHLPNRDLTNNNYRSVEPLYPTDELLGLIPNNPKSQISAKEILARLIDGSELDEFKKNYGETLICGFARILGEDVGIIANDGILFSESALKGAHFIELCNQRQIPMLFMQNIVGFMVGKDYEHKGIAKDGAKMVNAVATSTVPKITLIIGSSYGAGNYAMAGRAYNPNFLFTWPNAKIAVMGPEQAAGVLTDIAIDGKKQRGEQINQKEIDDLRAETLAKFTSQADALYASARLWDDGIISPLETRSVLGFALNIARGAPKRAPAYGVFRM